MVSDFVFEGELRKFIEWEHSSILTAMWVPRVGLLFWFCESGIPEVGVNLHSGWCYQTVQGSNSFETLYGELGVSWPGGSPQNGVCVCFAFGSPLSQPPPKLSLSLFDAGFWPFRSAWRRQNASHRRSRRAKDRETSRLTTRSRVFNSRVTWG